MKKIIRVGLILLCSFCFSIVPVFASINTNERTVDDYRVSDWVVVTDSNRDNILNTPSVDASEKVYDFADLFSPNQEEGLYSSVAEFVNTYNMDLAIVTINDNNKGSQAVYADDFYDYNEFGIGSSRDGLLFLIDMENRQIYMSTTGYAISMYNDYRIEMALDRVYTYMSDEAYYDGVLAFIREISNYADEGLPTYSSDYSKSETTAGEQLLKSFIGAFIITVIVMVILIRKNRLVKKATTAEEYLDKKSIDIKNMGEVFLGSHTVKHRIDHGSSSSGGGGSSTHSSSSGSSHGGGGHGF